MPAKEAAKNQMKELPPHKGLTAAQVLERYGDLPAFCGIDLTDVNQVGLFGERPLCVAAVGGDLDEMEALLDAGAALDASGELGNTALHEAVGQGHFEAVKLLVERGARTDIKNESGDTALDIAGRKGDEKLLTFLRS